MFPALVYAALIVLLAIWSYNSGLNLPPGPWGLPLIGHLHLLAGKPMHRALQSLSDKYGPVLFLRFGMVPTVIISSKEIVREISTTHDTNFSSRPYMVSAEHFSYGHSGMATCPYGKFWRDARKLCTVQLFTAKCIDSFAWMRKEELSLVLNSILVSHRGNKPVYVRTLTSTFGFNNITRILWSKRYYGDDATAAEAVEFKNLLHDIIELVIKPCIGNLVPWYLRWLDWQIPHYRSIHAKQEKFMGGIIEEHMNTTRGSKDFLDMMIEFYGTDPQGQKHIKANLTEMLLAGTDTSAATSEWFMAAMMHNPHILLKVQAELDMVVGKSRMVQESDIPNLEYFHLVLKEIFRCYSPVALIMPRQAAESTEVAGYHIPKGTNVLINAWAVHMDPAAWDNPTEFLPERFLGSSIDYKGQGFGLIPFGAGRRKCPGLQLGLRTVELLVANLIHGFEWSFVPGTKNSLEEVFNSACYLKTPLQAMATPRLSPEVYSNV